jgi:hypothetical protein
MLRKSFTLLFILTIFQCSIAKAQLQLLTPYSGSTCAGSTFASAINASGVLTCATPVSSVVLSSIAAATAGNTIANGDNTGQVWNWANTNDSTVAFAFGETSAATNGTSTSGVPNQVLLKLTTLANSTQSPLSVYSRGSHVFSVSQSAQQMLAADGSQLNPIYSFAAASGTGMYRDTGGTIRFAVGGGRVLVLNSNSQLGVRNSVSFSTPQFTSETNPTGMTVGGTVVGISSNGSETARFDAGILQASKGSADSVGYALNFRNSRGTVASPSVITTGDDLATINGYGYVGGTNTYVNTADIRITSASTISDATNGIGGQITLETQKQGTDTSPQARLRVDQLGHLASVASTANTPTMGSCGTSPSISGTDNVMLVTVGTGGSATSCTVTFGSTWTTNAPVCTAQNDTDKVAYSISTTTSAVTIAAAAAFTASSKFQVICVGRL